MIKAYAKSDGGKVREINEDSYYISEWVAIMVEK